MCLARCKRILVLFALICSLILNLSFLELNAHNEPRTSKVSDSLKLSDLLELSKNALVLNSDSAIVYAQKALLLAQKTNNHEEIVNSSLQLAKSYKYKGLYEKAIELVMSVSKYCSSENHANDQGRCLYMLGELNRASTQYADAINYLEQAVIIFKQIEDSEWLAKCYNRLAAINYKRLNFDEAILQADTAIIIGREYKNGKLVSSSYEILGAIYTYQGCFSKALKYFQNALAISQIEDDFAATSNILCNIAINYYKMKDYGIAIKYGNKAYQLAKEISLKPQLEVSSHFLAKSYAAKGNYELAYYYGEVSETLRVELFNEARDVQIAQLNAKYSLFQSEQEMVHQKVELEKRDLQLKQKRAQNKLMIGGIISFLFFLLLMIYIQYRFRRSNLLLGRQKEAIEDQKFEIEKQKEDLNDAYNRLKDLSEFREDMMNMIIHDLKNPLNAIINLAIVKESKVKNEMIQHSGKQMLNMVLNILDVYKFENAQLKLSTTSVIFSGVIENAYKEVRFLARKKNIRFLQKFQYDYETKLDGGIIERVFINLFSNAIKYSPLNSKIEVIVNRVDDEFFKVEVRDQGIGIKEAYHEKIFEKFSQVNISKDESVRSSGLGLTFSKMAIESHGGKIGVNSVPGNGATFWFTLPYMRKVEVPELLNKANKQEGEFESLVSQSEKQKIIKYIQMLQNLEVYAVSEIRKVIQEIEVEQVSGLEQWLEELNDAVIMCNGDNYERLINIFNV